MAIRKALWWPCIHRTQEHNRVFWECKRAAQLGIYTKPPFGFAHDQRCALSPFVFSNAFNSSVGNNTMQELSQESMNSFLLITTFKSYEYHIYPQRSWSPKSSTLFTSLLTSSSKVANRHKDSYFKNFILLSTEFNQQITVNIKHNRDVFV